MSNKVKIIILVVFLIISFSSRLGKFVVPNQVAYMPFLFLSSIAFVKAIQNKKIDNEKRAIIVPVLEGNLYIKIIIYVYTLFLVGLGLTETRFLSSNMQTFINSVSAISVFYLYGEKSFKYSIIALAIAWLLAVVTRIISDSFYFEFHDLAFASGFVIIYVLVSKIKYNKKEIKWFLLATTITFLAAKRIEFGALVIIVLADFITKQLNEKTQKIILKAGNFILLIMIYAFIIFTLDGKINLFFERFGINMMGRQYYYSVLKQYADFTIGFLGLGRNAMATLFTTDYSYMRVGNIHSDILRMYGECGFVVFAFWLINYFIIFPRMLFKRFGLSSVKMYTFCTWYLFILYFTDNTELYIATQYFYILVIIYNIYQQYKRGIININIKSKIFKITNQHKHNNISTKKANLV